MNTPDPPYLYGRGRWRADGCRGADLVVRVGRHLPAPAGGNSVQAGDAGAGLAPCSAHGPGADALAGEDLPGHGDLLGRGGPVGGWGVPAAAVAEPGLLGELQAAVEAVAGAGAPVAAGLGATWPSSGTSRARARTRSRSSRQEGPALDDLQGETVIALASPGRWHRSTRCHRPDTTGCREAISRVWSLRSAIEGLSEASACSLVHGRILATRPSAVAITIKSSTDSRTTPYRESGIGRLRTPVRSHSRVPARAGLSLSRGPTLITVRVLVRRARCSAGRRCPRRAVCRTGNMRRRRCRRRCSG